MLLEQLYNNFITMAPKYKLIYMNFKALGEPIRFLLAYGNIQFEEEIFDVEDWPNRKGSTPFGKVPILEIDGKKAHQSAAICRYLGKQVGLTGSNDWENFEIDMIADTLADLRTSHYDYVYETDVALKEKKLQTLKSETVPFYLPKFEEHVKKNGGYFVGGKLTWVDFYFAAPLETFAPIFEELEKEGKYPNLKALRQKILALPAVKAYLSKRPPVLR